MEFERTERDFSAMEAAELTGVSQTMQRDWRRHGYLPPSIPGKRVRFSLTDICILALAKIQTNEGKPVEGAIWTAKMSADVAMTQIELCQFGVEFKGIDLDPAGKRKIIYDLNEVEDKDYAASRYVFFPAKGKLHGTIDGSEAEGPTCYHFASLAEMESKVKRNWVYGNIFDLVAFAMSVSFKVREPLITYRLIEGEA
jgi:MerR-like DNA binding protein